MLFRVFILMIGFAALSQTALGLDGGAVEDPATTAPCERMQTEAGAFTVCTFPLETYEVRLHHAREDGSIFGQLSLLEAHLNAAGKTVVALTNGGMYHTDRRPVGLYVEDGETKRTLVRGDGPGNFQLLPNGVFWIEDGRAGVEETRRFDEAGRTPDYATQSGPMLVVDGELHPDFRAASENRYRRSGIGVSEDGETVIFAISEQPVTFHAFGSLFRDMLDVDNALFLDGKVCRLDLPAEGRHEPGLSMGPMLAVTLRETGKD